VEALHRRLLRRGVRPVLHHARNGSGARLSFIITARHTPGDIARAARALRGAMSNS
jgi:8-amino-7-oxononanoate synthase